MAEDATERTVTGPANGKFTVLTDTEEDAYNDLHKKYLDHNRFQNISDLQDLERIMMLEILILRYSNWMSTETDYFGELVDSKDMSRIIKDFSSELRQLKQSVGIDRSSRQKDHGESVADYLEDLRIRAKEFGIIREDMLTKSITLFNELKALVTLHDNCTPDERKEQQCEMDDLFDWLRTIAFPEFDKIDKHFVENTQKYYIREM